MTRKKEISKGAERFNARTVKAPPGFRYSDSCHFCEYIGQDDLGYFCKKHIYNIGAIPGLWKCDDWVEINAVSQKGDSSEDKKA